MAWSEMIIMIDVMYKCTVIWDIILVHNMLQNRKITVHILCTINNNKTRQNKY